MNTLIQRRLVMLCIVAAAALPYAPTLDDYFMQDDFGVVGLLSTKPAGSFPRWFVTPWMEDIWGEPPDELRPFPAVTYQMAAVAGAASPVANHAINIAFHAVNALLVFRIAETVGALSLGPAAFAALIFALLPMQAESVAWVTGRVDSMPACFYFASFLLFHLWRARPRASVYIWSVAIYFVALFTKQNTVTLPAALMLYDAIVEKRPVRPSWAWLRPYAPFVLLTLGYLALRYAVFGEVAREGRLGTEYFDLFLQNTAVHLKRMVFGEPGLRMAGLRAAALLAMGAAAVGVIGALAGERGRAGAMRRAVYFLVVWIALGLAPTVVAGYGSPRHMYLASAGWALTLGIALNVLWHCRPERVMKGLAVALGGVVLVVYGLQLREEVRLWGVRSDVSRRVVRDLEREAMAAPPGTLIIADPPQRSSNFALPYALRPPFTSGDLTARVSVISHSSIHCCAANFWEPYTRRKMREWMANAARPPVIVLRWDADTGELFRVHENQDPFLRSLVPVLLESRDVASLDRMLLNITSGLALSSR